MLKASECQALVVELSALKIKKKKKSMPFTKSVSGGAKVGAGSIPGTGQLPGQSEGFAQTSSVSCISQRQGQTVPKGQFLCSLDGKST